MSQIREAAPSTTIAQERAALGCDAIVSVETAARWLGGRHSEAVAVIRRTGWVRPHPVTGTPSIRWGRVIDLFEGADPNEPALVREDGPIPLRPGKVLKPIR